MQAKTRRDSNRRSRKAAGSGGSANVSLNPAINSFGESIAALQVELKSQASTHARPPLLEPVAKSGHLTRPDPARNDHQRRMPYPNVKPGP